MKYTNELEINLPLQLVIEFIENPENMKHWQPGLTCYELLSDSPGEVRSQMKLKYKMGKRTSK